MYGIFTYIYHKNQLHVGKYIQIVGKYIPVPWILWVWINTLPKTNSSSLKIGGNPKGMYSFPTTIFSGANC